jgi:hypothetical protein
MKHDLTWFCLPNAFRPAQLSHFSDRALSWLLNDATWLHWVKSQNFEFVSLSSILVPFSVCLSSILIYLRISFSSLLLLSHMLIQFIFFCFSVLRFLSLFLPLLSNSNFLFCHPSFPFDLISAIKCLFWGPSLRAVQTFLCLTHNETCRSGRIAILTYLNREVVS